MKTVSMRSKVLATAMSLSILSFSAISSHANTTIDSSKDERTTKMEQRAKKMLENSIAAANSPITANQAITIAQQQITKSNAMGVHYGTKRAGKNNTKKSTIDNQSRTLNTNKPSYHVRLVDNEDRHYHVQIDGKTGEVLSKKEHQKHEGHRIKNRNATSDNKKPRLKPTISLSQAMDIASSHIGGEAVGGGFGKMNIKNRKHSRFNMPTHRKGMTGSGRMHNGKMTPIHDRNSEPSYHIQVVKNSQVYFVNLDAQTGKIIKTRTQEQMKAELEKRQNHWKQMREQRRQVQRFN